MLFEGAGLECEERSDVTAADSGLRIFQVMPRNMYFGGSRATSIDLCVRDLISASRFRESTKVFAEKVADSFLGFRIDTLPAAKRAPTSLRAKHIAAAARRSTPDIIIVQQHLPTAVALAAQLPKAKILLHTHNFQKSYPRGSLISALRRGVKKRRYSRLAGIIHVSQSCKNAFARDWPSVTAPGCVVNNGLDFLTWHPERDRSQEILCVGRCAPEKGIFEAAKAVAAFLPDFPGWRARFILSNVDTHRDYFEKTRNALGAAGPQAVIQVQRPFEEIKEANERAAIALVPSRWIEPFGRTALEAHAGGAALISSGTGGLAEISGNTALYLSAISPEAIASALKTLLTDQPLRSRLAYEGAESVRARFDIRKQAALLDRFCLAIAHDQFEAIPQEVSRLGAERLRAVV